MKRSTIAGLVLALALPAAAAAAVGVERHEFRFERPLVTGGAGPIELEPDGPLFAHTRPGFVDVRIVDADGRQIPWRTLPEPPLEAERAVAVLDRGRQGGDAVALLDLGRARGVYDEVTLEFAAGGFVGTVTVYGSDDRRTFTRLSTTRVFDIAGALSAKSTTVLLPPSDFRFLRLRGRRVPLITGATIVGTQRPRLRPVRASVRVRHRAGATLVTLDLGYAHVPVDELRLTAATPKYDRSVLVGGQAFRIARVGPISAGRLPVALEGRFIRLRIVDGDDEPLRGLRVNALARPRTLLVARGGPRPLTLLYGGAVDAPAYDYARLPRSALDLAHARRATLGAERPNPHFAVRDTRSFVSRHRAIVTAALAVAALTVITAAALALRKP